MSDLHVDPVLLDGIADRLHRRGDTINAVGAGAPTAPDAGQDTATVAAIVAALCDSSANLVDGLLEIGARVTAARQAYVSEDDAAARTISGLYWCLSLPGSTADRTSSAPPPAG
jgi:hypothetical protein